MLKDSHRNSFERFTIRIKNENSKFLKYGDMRICIGDTLFSAANLSEDGYILKCPLYSRRFFVKQLHSFSLLKCGKFGILIFVKEKICKSSLTLTIP